MRNEEKALVKGTRIMGKGNERLEESGKGLRKAKKMVCGSYSYTPVSLQTRTSDRAFVEVSGRSQG